MRYYHYNKSLILVGSLLSLTLLSGLILSSSTTKADTRIRLTVPTACTLSTPSGSNLTTSINPGQSGLIGTTTLKATCNDGEGLAIYAIGYTGDIHGDNNLRKQETGNTLSTTTFIPTGAASSPSASQWNMVVANNTDIQGNLAATIPSAFQSTHIVPSTQALIASYPSTTDQSAGTNIKVTYNAYIASNQVAGTYEGKVKYTLVHPSNHEAPADRPATLDTGQTVNSKMKSLAKSVATGTTSTVAYSATDSYIKAIDVHTETSAPSGFTPSEANTISSSTSEHPIYIVFDNTNNAGIMHFYTEGDKIFLPADSSYMFYFLGQLTDLSDIAGWDTSSVTNMSNMFNGTPYMDTASINLTNWNTSSVTNMSGMFSGAGSGATTFALDLSGWDTSSVTNMSGMFAGAGYSATTWSISGLSDWDTSSITEMSGMFYSAGYSATTFSLDLSGWNTSNVTNMSGMFSNAGYYSTNFSLDLSGWNTASVTDMSSMFYQAGYSTTAANWSVVIPQTNGNSINNTTSRMYGKTTSYYGAPDSGKAFTLAQ